MTHVPPDLSHLGDMIDASIRRAIERRRARARVIQRSLLAGVAGVVAVAVLAPSPLSTPGDPGGGSLLAQRNAACELLNPGQLGNCPSLRTLVTDAASMEAVPSRPAAPLPPF